MTRKEFLRVCSILGIGIPIQGAFSSCNSEPVLSPSDTVIIIGAGAAGLSAAYLLKQQGIEAQILEASSRYGGRMKRSDDFADFPIPLGGEWIHVERGILNEIVNDSSIPIDVNSTPYDPDVDVGLLDGEQVDIREIGFTIDQKFIGSSWFDFYEQYVVPSIEAQISFNKVVNSIDYSGDRINIKTRDEEYTSDVVIIAVPVKILQKGTIRFIPDLPNDKKDDINGVTVWDGCKAFIEFSEKFYPTFTGFTITPETAGQKLYYDAAYGQNTNKNILGLFAVGTGTKPYVDLPDPELIEYMLSELDQLFDGKASAAYIKHIFQNWNEEPFANGAYVYDYEDWRRMRRLGESVDNKLFFAGDAYFDGEDWSSVHVAARSARRVVEELT